MRRATATATGQHHAGGDAREVRPGRPSPAAHQAPRGRVRDAAVATLRRDVRQSRAPVDPARAVVQGKSADRPLLSAQRAPVALQAVPRPERRGRAFNATTFSKSRERLLEAEVVRAFFAEVVAEAGRRGLLSDEQFSVDGTLLEAWASLKSYRPRDEQESTSAAPADVGPQRTPGLEQHRECGPRGESSCLSAGRHTGLTGVREAKGRAMTSETLIERCRCAAHWETCRSARTSWLPPPTRFRVGGMFWECAPRRASRGNCRL